MVRGPQVDHITYPHSIEPEDLRFQSFVQNKWETRLFVKCRQFLSSTLFSCKTDSNKGEREEELFVALVHMKNGVPVLDFLLVHLKAIFVNVEPGSLRNYW